MHKQNRSDREIGLENIMESMYSEKTVPCSKCQGKGCEHCDGTGTHTVEEGEVCPKCGKVHTINAGCSKVHEADSDIDHHNQYMMDRDLLNPLHAAAQRAGAKNITDWMIKQIKDQGDHWVEWFIENVIGDEEADASGAIDDADWMDDDDIGRIPHDVDSFG